MRSEVPRFTWSHNVDHNGYVNGRFQTDILDVPIKVAVPGPAHKGLNCIVFLRGEKVGEMPNLNAAKALAELHLLRLLEKAQGIDPLSQSRITEPQKEPPKRAR